MIMFPIALATTIGLGMAPFESKWFSSRPGTALTQTAAALTWSPPSKPDVILTYLPRSIPLTESGTAELKLVRAPPTLCDLLLKPI